MTINRASSSASRLRAVAAALLHMLIAGATYPVLAFVARGYTPLGVLGLRTALGGLLLASAALVLGGGRTAFVRPLRDEPWRLVVLGIAAVPINQGFLLAGLIHAEIAHAAILYALTPVLVAVAAYFLLGERLGWLGGAGVAISLLGALVVLRSRGLAPSGAAFARGDLYILVGVAGWVAYTLMSKPLVERYGVLAITAWAHVIGAAAAAPFAGWAIAQHGWPRPAIWAGIVALAVGTSFINYLLWSYALSRLPTAVVAVTSNLQPAIAAVIGWVWGGERPTLLLGVGGLLVISGVSVTFAARAPRR